ncbi:MAG: PAS domain S-box protein [Ginsengibacter sp.]
MKNFFLRKISVVQRSVLYVMAFSIAAFLVFIIIIHQNKSASISNTATASSGAVIAIFIIVGLSYRLNRDIRFRKDAMDGLAENEIKYRSLIENAGVVMFTTSIDGKFTFASSKAFQLTGFTLEQLKDMNYSALIDKDYLEMVNERYREQIKNHIKETYIEFCIRTQAGDLKWVGQSAVLIIENTVPTGFQCIVKDISERKQMEEIVRKYKLQLVQNQDRLQSILDNTTSLIYIKDLEGRYLLTNKKFKQVFDVNDEAIIGKTSLEIVTKDQAKGHRNVDEEVIRSKKAIEVEEVITSSTGVHNLLITKFPLLDTQNNVYGISGIATDITERVRYQQQLMQAKAIAEDAKRLQEQFLANMSHKIRMTMNGIQGMTDLLLETSLSDEQHDFAKTIKNSSDNLLVIINDILDFSKIQAGKLTIEKIDFKLTEVLDNIKAVFKHKVFEKGLTLHLNVNEDVPATLNGDPYLLNQVLVNLIGNAIKFTHQGGIQVSISIDSSSEKEISLCFTVKDSGIGIAPDKIDVIFESFIQANIDTSRKYGGTGLGLAITRQLLDMQQGKITVESELGCGTAFRFYLPYSHAKTNSTTFFSSKGVSNYRTLLTGKKFLVAEDNEVNQKVITHVLQKAGGTVEIANNGLEAINYLKENPAYDLIIMDLQMPQMDGYAATKYIRNVMNLSIPIIAMTASALKGEKSKCITMGMNDYLSKPFDVTFIYKRISMLLGEATATNTVKKMDERGNNDLYDLSLIEEMNDDDYVADILQIFLENTPVELNELKLACVDGKFDNAYKVAHKLKSSAARLKAENLLVILNKIEEQAKSLDGHCFARLAQLANENYLELVTPLQKHLSGLRPELNIAF